MNLEKTKRQLRRLPRYFIFGVCAMLGVAALETRSLADSWKDSQEWKELSIQTGIRSTFVMIPGTPQFATGGNIGVCTRFQATNADPPDQWCWPDAFTPLSQIIRDSVTKYADWSELHYTNQDQYLKDLEQQGRVIDQLQARIDDLERRLKAVERK